VGDVPLLALSINYDKTMNNERKTIYLCLAHMSEAGMEQKYIKQAFDDNYVVPLGPNVNGFVPVGDVPLLALLRE